MKYIVVLVRIIAVSGALLHQAGGQADVTRTDDFTVTGDDSLSQQRSTLSGSGVIDLPPLYSAPQSHAAETQQLIPGMLSVRQHGAGSSGDYFIRGMNLNHGAGVISKLDGIPLNVNSHVAGQGYTDLNIVVPELIESYEYSVGPHNVSAGSGAYAGSIEYSAVNAFDESILQMSLGQDLYFRMVAATSDKTDDGDFLYSVDIESYDGPWKNIKEDEESLASYIKKTWNRGAETYGVSVIAYRNDWNVPTQIPERAVNNGSISDLDVVDVSDHGKTRLVGLSLHWNSKGNEVRKKASWFISAYEYRLFSNNTYFIDVNGDQTGQVDKRVSWGGEYVYESDTSFDKLLVTNIVGAQLQYDGIGESAIYHTDNRERLDTIRSDRIQQGNIGLFFNNTTRLSQNLSGMLNLRYDVFNFDVASNNVANSGDVTDNITAGGVGLDYAASKNTVIFLKYSQNHSVAHARDITGTMDPTTGNSIKPQMPFAKINGGELGVRVLTGDLAATASLWQLESANELVYMAENNTTISTRSSERSGIDLATQMRLSKYTSANLGASFSDSAYVENSPGSAEGADKIPGVPGTMLVASLAYMKPNDYFGSVHLKYLGKRPLNESGSIESDALAIVNLRAGYRDEGFSFHFDILNMFNSNARETEFLYESQLEGETARVLGRHYRIAEPRTYRLYVTHEFL